MRVAVVIEYFDPRLGGAERSTDQILRELAARGHDVTLVTGGAPPDVAAPAPVAIRRHRGSRKPRTGPAALRFATWAAREAFSRDFDASLSVTPLVPATLVQPRAGVVRESMMRSLAATPSPLARALRRLGQVTSLRKRCLLRLEAATFADPRVHRYVAISAYMKRQMMTHYAVPETRIAVVPNAADVAPLAADERRRRRAAARAARGWTDRDRIVLFPALDPARKGLAPLLRAIALVAARRPEVRLAIAGPYPPWARRLARSLGVAARVDDLGVVESIADLYCAADVTALPTWYDPASKVVIESLQAGTPVITSRYNGAADWIEAAGDPAAGAIVDEPDDVGTLAATIDALLTRGASHAPRLDAAALSMSRHVDRLEELLREAAG